jgi:hypothetical protein
MKALGFETDAGIREDCERSTFNGKPVTIKQAEIEGGPKYVNTGDRFDLTFCEEGKTVYKMSEDIKAPMIIDRVAMFEITDELGFKHAICGAFGSSINSKPEQKKDPSVKPTTKQSIYQKILRWLD